MLQKLLAIIRVTFTETVRQPIFGVLLWTAAGMLAINPSIAAFSLESGGDSKIMKDIGLSTLLLYGLLASVFSAAGVITREIESSTVLTVVSKPVSRPLFLVGKYVGVAAAVAVGYYLLFITLMLTAQQGVMETTADKYDQPMLVFAFTALGISLAVAVFGNLFYGWHFPATLLACAVPLGTLALVGSLLFDRQWQTVISLEELGATLELSYAGVAAFGGVLVLSAFAVALSTRCNQVLTLVLCAGVFILGLCSDYLFGAGPTLAHRFMAAVVPNFQFFWLGDAITQELTIRGEHVARVVAYAAIYTSAVLAAGVALFQTREVG